MTAVTGPKQTDLWRGTAAVCEAASGREAVEAFSFDARWKYACGELAFGYPSFSHNALVDMWARLAASDRPERT